MDSVLIEYLQSGKAWLMVGSGPSIETGYPSWERLATIATEITKSEQVGVNLAKIDSSMAKRDYPQVFQDLNTILGEDRLLQILRDNLKPTHAGQIYELITKWPILVYLTTNYDDELQSNLAKLGVSYIPYSNSEDHLSLLVPDFSGAIMKLHGDLRSTDGLILTTEQYEDINTGECWEYWRTKMTSVFQMNRVIVIGHSLTDKNIRHVLEAAKKGARVTQPVCWIAPDVSEKERREYLEKYRIRVITYDNRDGAHKNLVKLIESISEFIPPRTVVYQKEQIERVTSSPLGANAAAPGFFVFNVFATKVDYEQKRIDIMISALQSALPEINALGTFTLESALEFVGWPKGKPIGGQFGDSIRDRAIKSGLFIPIKEELSVSEKSLSVALQNRKRFNQIKEHFKNSLVLRIRREFTELNASQASRITNDIEASLTGYFREGGLSLASALFSSNRPTTAPGSIVPFVLAASTRYDDLTMRLAFFKSSIDMFLHPETAEKNFLGRISHGFFAFHALGVFGDVAIERLRHAKETVWLIDSDTQIRALAIGAPTNAMYRECLLGLKERGIRLFTTASLCTETREHLWFADKVIKDWGPSSPYVYAAAQGNTPYKKRNELLEGFINWQDAGNPCDWRSYLYQIFRQRNFSDVNIEATLIELGIEVVAFEEWPGFSDLDFAKIEEYAAKITGIWEGARPLWLEDESDQVFDSHRKARPEAEALNIVKKEREGEYYIISEKGQGSPSWFVSYTSIINMLETKSRITWQPEAFASFASTLCDITDAQLVEHAFNILLLGLAQSGVSLLDDDTIARVFGRVIDQAKLDIEELRQQYQDTLEEKYGEPFESVLARVSPLDQPFVAVQLANEAALKEAERRKAAETAARRASERADISESKLRKLDKYRLKLLRRQSRPTKEKKPHARKKKRK